jgi:hypothetical protein
MQALKVEIAVFKGKQTSADGNLDWRECSMPPFFSTNRF